MDVRIVKDKSVFKTKSENAQLVNGIPTLTMEQTGGLEDMYLVDTGEGFTFLSGSWYTVGV